MLFFVSISWKGSSLDKLKIIIFLPLISDDSNLGLEGGKTSKSLEIQLTSYFVSSSQMRKEKASVRDGKKFHQEINPVMLATLFFSPAEIGITTQIILASVVK